MVGRGTSLHCHHVQHSVFQGCLPQTVPRTTFCPSAPARHMARVAAGHSTACAHQELQTCLNRLEHPVLPHSHTRLCLPKTGSPRQC